MEVDEQPLERPADLEGPAGARKAGAGRGRRREKWRASRTSAQSGEAHRGRLLEVDRNAAAGGVLDGMLGVVVFCKTVSEWQDRNGERARRQSADTKSNT